MPLMPGIKRSDGTALDLRFDEKTWSGNIRFLTVRS
jgi:hypothetical protein